MDARIPIFRYVDRVRAIVTNKAMRSAQRAAGQALIVAVTRGVPLPRRRAPVEVVVEEPNFAPQVQLIFLGISFQRYVCSLECLLSLLRTGCGNRLDV